jgi:hypothetical protein
LLEIVTDCRQILLLKRMSEERPLKMRSPGRKPRDWKRIRGMIEEALVDAYGESEQRTAFFTMIEDNLAVPFKTEVLGVEVTVDKVDLGADEQIVAICARGRERQAIPILDLPLPEPAPDGSEWIEAFRTWVGGAW